MDLLALIEKLYGGSALLAEPALCLNSRSSRSACTACTEVCPAGALQQAGRGPELDPLLCKGCGLCAPVCPTGVFALKETAALLPKLGEGKTVSLTCSAFQGEDRVKVPCLAGLSPESVAAAAAGRRLLLVAPDSCEGCTLGADGRLERLAALAEQLLAGFGLAGTVRLAYGEEAAASEAAQANQLDRRQFLNIARLGLFSAAAQIVRPEKEAATLQDLPTQVPEGRRQFLTAVRKQAVDPPADAVRGALPFAAITAAPGCDGCAACTSACPSGALRLAQAEQADQLTFLPDRCLACGLCVEACPRHLLTLQERFSPRAVARGESQPLASLPRATCSRCGQPFYGDGERCGECRKVDWMTAELFRLR